LLFLARSRTKQLGSGAIADGETDAKNASVDGPLPCSVPPVLCRRGRRDADRGRVDLDLAHGVGRAVEALCLTINLKLTNLNSVYKTIFNPFSFDKIASIKRT
jgi:hypothetical protein